MNIQERISQALCGNYPDRKGELAKGIRPTNKGTEEKELHITEFNRHLSKRNKPQTRLTRPLLEALVLIPEEAGIIENIQRVLLPKDSINGFYTPHYTKDVKPIFDAFFKRIAKSNDIYDIYIHLKALKELLPEEFVRFNSLLGVNALINGINKIPWMDKRAEHQMEKFGSLSQLIYEAEINVAKEKGLIKALWEHGKKSPTGYIDVMVWELIADFLIYNEERILTCCSFIKSKLSKNGLARCLSLFPTNREAAIKGNTPLINIMPSKKDTEKTFELIEKALKINLNDCPMYITTNKNPHANTAERRSKWDEALESKSP